MILSSLRLSVTLFILAYASAQDWQTREVTDAVWVLGIPICLVLDSIEIAVHHLKPTPLIISLGIALLLGVVLFYVGFYGGADSKAMLLIAAALPAYLQTTERIFMKFFPLPIFMIFVISTLFSLVYPLTFLILNLVDYGKGKRLLQGIDVQNWVKRATLYITTRKKRLEELKGSLKYFPAETVVEEDGRVVRKPVYFIPAEANIDERIEKLEEHQELFDEGVLSSPTIPMIVFMTVGFAFTILLDLFL